MLTTDNRSQNKATMKASGSFGALFRSLRLRSEFSTLSEFGEELAKEGFIFEDSIFSHWQKGTRIPRNRGLLIVMVKIFMKRGSVVMLKEADRFLESAGQGYLTDTETKMLLNKSVSPAGSRRQSISQLSI